MRVVTLHHNARHTVLHYTRQQAVLRSGGTRSRLHLFRPAYHTTITVIFNYTEKIHSTTLLPHITHHTVLPRRPADSTTSIHLPPRKPCTTYLSPISAKLRSKRQMLRICGCAVSMAITCKRCGPSFLETPSMCLPLLHHARS